MSRSTTQCIIRFLGVGARGVGLSGPVLAQGPPPPPPPPAGPVEDIQATLRGGPTSLDRFAAKLSYN